MAIAIDKFIKENIEQHKKNVNKKQFMKIYREEFSDLNKQLIGKTKRLNEVMNLIKKYEDEMCNLVDEIEELEKNNIKILLPKDFLD